MTQTEWIISLDDDLKDIDELFVGNVRDGEQLTRCSDCYWYDEDGTCVRYSFLSQPTDYCSNAERKQG